ncbi:MAG: VacJ family lipoprotein [Myxococcota bacterium]|nr:VacJ family lipoprotein [Myxococcota bacterium]
MAATYRRWAVVYAVAAALLLVPAGAAAEGSAHPPDPPVVSTVVENPHSSGGLPNDELEPDPLFDDEAEPEEIYDPFETSNRAIYSFNRGASKVFFDPLTRGYRFVVPGVVRRAILRAFHNLNAPIFIVNNLLQLRPLDALETLGAFAMNLTFGLGGLVETASGAGLALVPADFGQTLAKVGVGPGPYIIMPLLGPTTLRDGLGFVVDRAFHPLTYVLAVPVQLIGYGGIGVARRDEVRDQMQALESSSIDPYAVLRSAYTQARAKQIEAAGRPETAASSL